jgi:hypothetical protein
MSDPELEQVFQQGVAAIRAGDKAKARELLTKVVEQNQLHEQAWLWLSAAVTDKQEQILCLENVLTINPNNEIAQKGLRKLGGTPPAATAEAAPPLPEPKPEPAPVKEPDSAWREKLKDADYVSEATIVKPIHETPRLGVGDLANAWMWAAIFQIPGPYEEHVEYGPAGHILISAVVSIFIEMIGIVGFIMLIFSNPKILSALRQSSSSRLPAGANSLTTLIPTTGASMATLAITLLAAFVVLVLITLVGLFFQAIVTNRVAEWLGGTGSMIPLIQAMAIALVPSQLIMVPLLVIWAAAPASTIPMVLLGGGWLYQFLQSSNAVNAAHKTGIFASMGVVIISGFAMGLIGCCLSFGSQLLFGVASR